MSLVVAIKTDNSVVMASDGQTNEAFGRISNTNKQKVFKIKDKYLFGYCGSIAANEYFRMLLMQNDAEIFTKHYDNPAKFIEEVHKLVLKTVEIYGKEDMVWLFMSIDICYNGSLEEGEFFLGVGDKKIVAIGAERQTAVELLNHAMIYESSKACQMVMEHCKDLNIYIGGKTFVEVINA